MIDKIADLFRSSEEVPDLLEVLGLEGGYLELSEEEQEKLYEYSTAVGTGGKFNQLDQSVTSTSQTQQGYLKGVGSSAVSSKDYDFAEKVLLKALEAEDDNPTDRHFVYNSLIDLYYKQRDYRDDAIEKCIQYCKEDIEIVDDFLDEWKQEYGGELPNIPSFKRMAIIYEKQGRYEEALEVCEMALDRGLDDGTKGGFEGRKERVQNKMDE
ncbi:tetratricopeptide repeat protein [Halopiger aswanensis]|uniref:Tetratricopeptide repeat protein n=1 Tax=Halopiger aswanensis TaxID=148449 RepID=A0A419VV00_9EURY|nr:tetratricopeptide repeat protein [Halopiger aswanensis]RKD85217.1 tetratricopeptide repeat protein [Halopiger aswanensis]